MERLTIMKILLAHNYYQQPGGEDVVFQNETFLLREKGHEVIHYTKHNDSIKHMNPLEVAFNTIWSFSTKKELLKILKEEKPDVAHFHNIFPLISPSAYYACREAGIPVIQTLHNYRLLCPSATFYRNGKICEECIGNKIPLCKTLKDYENLKSPQYKKFIFPLPSIIHSCYHNSRLHNAIVAIMLTIHRKLKTWHNLVDIYIALTEFAKKKFIEGGLPEEKIFVKPNFVYPEPGIRKENGSYALFVGRLSNEKGIWTILKAWEKLRGIPLKIAGDGPMIDDIKRFLKEKNINGIEILGKCDKKTIIKLMECAKFLIFPSEWYEGFPITILETFSRGIPVIASYNGSMSEIIQDGNTGLCFSPGNSDLLAEKVIWAWEHEEEMKSMGEKGRIEFQKKYSYEKAQINYEYLINHTIKRNR
jgi:glycosyltransferase involved in cell wall biosynthesis